MKALNLVLIALLFSQYICDADDYTEYCGHEENDPQKAEDCNNRKISPNSEDGKYCCFIKDNDGTECEVFSQEMYDKVEDLVESAEDAGQKDVSIECGSNYIMISLLSLILLFL